MSFIIQSLYFALPIYLANMAPVLVKKIPWLNAPIDGGKFWRSKPVLGKNKTWRGFVAAIIFACFTIWIQRLLFLNVEAVRSISLLNYGDSTIVLYGFFLGMGAIVGDLVKSFFKRRFSRPAGSLWFPFDQIDFMLGAMIFSFWLDGVGYKVWLLLLLITPFLHWLINVVAYKLRLKNVPW